MGMRLEEHELSGAEAYLAYRASSSVEARSLAAYLDEAGVEAHVLGEALQGGYGGINVGSMNAVEVWVSGPQRQIAESLVATWRQEVAATKSAENEENAGRRGRRPSFQYSMATALIVMTIVAVYAALVGRGLMWWVEVPRSLLGLLYLVIYIALAVKYFRYLRSGNED
jgi:hypothetical protein